MVACVCACVYICLCVCEKARVCVCWRQRWWSNGIHLNRTQLWCALEVMIGIRECQCELLKYQSEDAGFHFILFYFIFSLSFFFRSLISSQRGCKFIIVCVSPRLSGDRLYKWLTASRWKKWMGHTHTHTQSRHYSASMFHLIMCMILNIYRLISGFYLAFWFSAD